MKLFLLLIIGCNILTGSEIFTDKEKGLVWQDDPSVKNNQMNWHQAQTYCSNLSLEGYSDWRLPSVQELETIVDITKDNITIKKGFKNISPEGYWASTEVASIPQSTAWVAGFSYGFVGHAKKTDMALVRCVRHY